MTKDFIEAANDVMIGIGLLRQGAPDAMKAFASLSIAATASGTIDTKTKEMMALASASLPIALVALPITRKWLTSMVRADKR